MMEVHSQEIEIKAPENDVLIGPAASEQERGAEREEQFQPTQADLEEWFTFAQNIRVDRFQR
jgi:hypothetical protein